MKFKDIENKSINELNDLLNEGEDMKFSYRRIPNSWRIPNNLCILSFILEEMEHNSPIFT